MVSVYIKATQYRRSRSAEHTSRSSSEPFIACIVSVMFAMSCGLSTPEVSKIGRAVDEEPGVMADFDAIADVVDVETRISRG